MNDKGRKCASCRNRAWRSADVGCRRLRAHVINACQGLTADGQGLPDMMTDWNVEMRSRHISRNAHVGALMKFIMCPKSGFVDDVEVCIS